MTQTLSSILKDCRTRLEEDKKEYPHHELLANLNTLPPSRPFAQTLRDLHNQKIPAIIAEIKKQSPSQGLLRDPFMPSDIAEDYQKNGAACLSVLCERDWFGGHPQHLTKIKGVTSIPLMRKDFIFDHYQVDQSKSIGADAILLILSILDDTLAHELESHAHELNLDVLVEVHNPQELERALSMKSSLVGINNRNLDTLSIETHNALSLAQNLPENTLIIAESGFNSPSDIQPYINAGISCFLIGTLFMKTPSPGNTLSSLLKEISS
jgi:indole-3-glycerol phosphate synthase